MERPMEGSTFVRAATPDASPGWRRPKLQRASSSGTLPLRWEHHKRARQHYLERIPSLDTLQSEDIPTEDATEQRVTSQHRAWRYVEGFASGLVDHLEGKALKPKQPEQWSLLGGVPGTSFSLAVLVGLFAVGCADPCSLASLPVWTQGPAATLRVGALWLAARHGGPLALPLAKQHPALAPYTVLLEGLLPYTAGFAAGVLSLLLGLQRVSDPSWAATLESLALALMAASALTAARWLVECLYSTRLLKLRCGQQVLQNAWERAVIDRFQDVQSFAKPGSPANALPTVSGIWEFDLQCAELIRLHAEEMTSPKDQDTEKTEALDMFKQLTGWRVTARAEPEVEGQPTELPTGTERSRTLLLEDLKRTLPEVDAERAWAWLWGDGDEGSGGWLWQDSPEGPGVDECTFVQRMLQTRVETRELVSSICEYNTIFALFRNVVACAYFAAMAVLALMLFCPSALEKLWWTLSSVLVAVSFVFGPLMRDACESLALILFIRPFDVQDRVVIADERLVVVEVNVLTTTFLNGYNELVWLRNSQIFADRAGVRNLSRSEHAECAVELDLWVEDSIAANIGALEQVVRKWCEARPNIWVADQCGDATCCSGPTAGVLCSTAASGPGVVRWRFRAVHRLSLHTCGKVKVDTSRLMTALIEACLAKGIRLRRPRLDVHQQPGGHDANDDEKAVPALVDAHQHLSSPPKSAPLEGTVRHL